MNMKSTNGNFLTKRFIRETCYKGIANPSGAVALDCDHFIVADDEDNLLRIYHRKVTEKPLQTIPLKDVFTGEITDGTDLEIDLEGATELGGRHFWIGSHSASRKGKHRPARHRLLALHITRDVDGKFAAEAEGSIYKSLIDDLEQDSRFDSYHFNEAGTLQPKAIGALSIEGLAATPEHGLLIGFRNPLSGGEIKGDRLVGGKALLINLLNPFEVISGQAAIFGDPIELDLGGFGIRDIVQRKKYKYLIVAGPYHENDEDDEHKKENTQLYSWSTKSGKLKRLKKIKLDDLNIEAAFFYPGKIKTVQLFSDDGKLDSTQGFRSIRLQL